MFRLQDCAEYTYDAAVAEDEETVGQDIFEDECWYFRLYLEAEDRLNANYERKQRRHQISLDDLNNEHCREIGDFTWDGLAKLLDQEEVNQVQKFLKMMTGKQQYVVTLYFIEQRGTQDMNVCLREQAQAAAEALLGQGMKLDGYLAWVAEQGNTLDNQAWEILEELKLQQGQAQQQNDDGAPTEAPHSGFGGERSSGEMSEPCPQGEVKGMEHGRTMGGMSL